MESLLAWSEDPAFALCDGKICLCNGQAMGLGLRTGTDAGEVFPGLTLPAEGTAETEVLLDLRLWTLRSARLGSHTLCLLRPVRERIAGPTETTLLHTAGSIRVALQELTVALGGLAETAETQEAGQMLSEALRSTYRLRRTAEELELFARLRAGSYRVCCRLCQPVEAARTLCLELEELLALAGLRLRWQLPEKELCLNLDWSLITALLRELVTNAAANAADGQIRLTMAEAGANRLRFTVENQPRQPLPPDLFQRHAESRNDLGSGLGLGLGLVSAGAEAHGGSLLLSQRESGAVAALLTVIGRDGETGSLASPVFQLPGGYNAALSALSPVLPASVFHPDGLL